MAAGTARAETVAKPASTSCTASVSRPRVLSNSWLAATDRMARSLGSPPPLPAEISCAEPLHLMVHRSYIKPAYSMNGCNAGDARCQGAALPKTGSS